MSQTTSDREARQASGAEALRLIRDAILQRERFLLTSDRKSTRLNSSHANSSYAVFCLKKKSEAQRLLVHHIPTNPEHKPPGPQQGRDPPVDVLRGTAPPKGPQQRWRPTRPAWPGRQDA